MRAGTETHHSANVGFAYDYTADIPTAVVQRHSYANATAFYLSYQATEKLKFNNRVDYASGSNGAFGYVSTSNIPHDQLLAYTLTADYALWANVISRAEFRWDHALRGVLAVDPASVGLIRLVDTIDQHAHAESFRKTGGVLGKPATANCGDGLESKAGENRRTVVRTLDIT